MLMRRVGRIVVMGCSILMLSCEEEAASVESSEAVLESLHQQLERQRMTFEKDPPTLPSSWWTMAPLPSPSLLPHLISRNRYRYKCHLTCAS